MSEIVKIILASSLTIIGGVLVFVAGQLVVKFVIEPIQELKKTLAEIHYSLVFHACPILSSFGKEDWDNTADILRKLSCDLSARIEAVPLYDRWESLSHKFLPDKKKAREASRFLMALSNSMHDQDRSKNGDIVKKIFLLLNFDIDE
jgi:hypothetical protein